MVVSIAAGNKTAGACRVRVRARPRVLQDPRDRERSRCDDTPNSRSHQTLLTSTSCRRHRPRWRRNNASAPAIRPDASHRQWCRVPSSRPIRAGSPAGARTGRRSDFQNKECCRRTGNQRVSQGARLGFGRSDLLMSMKQNGSRWDRGRQRGRRIEVHRGRK